MEELFTVTKVKTMQMSIGWCGDKQNVAYPYNGILFSSNKEQRPDVSHNLNKPKNHYVKGNKIGVKSNVL
jgi:hypothetical protein